MAEVAGGEHGQHMHQLGANHGVHTTNHGPELSAPAFDSDFLYFSLVIINLLGSSHVGHQAGLVSSDQRIVRQQDRTALQSAYQLGIERAAGICKV